MGTKRFTHICFAVNTSAEKYTSAPMPPKSILLRSEPFNTFMAQKNYSQSDAVLQLDREEYLLGIEL